MKTGLIKIHWDKIENFNDEEISYYLFLEGKSIEVIARIRNLDTSVVQKHIIEGKIKYRFLAKSNNIKEFFITISKAEKQDKLIVLNSLDTQNKNKMIQYIRDSYVDMHSKQKETAIWILGELKDKSCLDILTKASVHKFVNIRRMAVSAMGKMGDACVENALIRALNDTNPQVVMYAVNSLKKIGSIKAFDKIITLKDKSDKEYVIKAIDTYLSEIENEES